MQPNKSTVEEIRQRFDKDVERFSNLNTAQATVPDSRYMWEMVADRVAMTNPDAADLLDIGCGAGNNSLYVLKRVPNLHVTLVDLSKPMLDRATKRVGKQTTGRVTAIQKDVRDLEMGTAQYDIITAGFVLHHLRTDDQWELITKNIYHALRLGGSFWLVDMFEFDEPKIQKAMWQHYGQFLTQLKGEAFKDEVFAYVQKEDTPRSVGFVTKQLEKNGFKSVEILHKKQVFAALTVIKS